MRLSDRDDIPVVPDLITLSEAAALLGKSRQNVHVMAAKGRFTTLARLGSDQPIFVVSRAEIENMPSGKKVPTES